MPQPQNRADGPNRRARPPTPPPKPKVGQRKPPRPPVGPESRESAKRPAPQWPADQQSDDFLLSVDDDDLYRARIDYLSERRPSHARRRGDPSPPPVPRNAANADAPRSQKTILTYNESSQSPTKDLQILVLALVREQILRESVHLGNSVNEQNPFEMRNMRLNSFIASTQDILDYWRAAVLEEGRRIIDETIELDEMAWVTPGGAAAQAEVFPAQLDESALQLLPPDKPEISKSRVATEYIQAQRGQRPSDLEDGAQLFQTELLRAEVAAAATPDTFEQVRHCYKTLLQKLVEIEHIEGKPETVEAVTGYIEQMKSHVDNVVQELLKQDGSEAVTAGRTFTRVLIGQIMDELHAAHKKNNFKPMEVHVGSSRRD